MRSIRRILVVAGATLALSLFVPAVAASSPINHIVMTKVCGPADLAVCTVTETSDPGVIPLETYGVWTGPRFDPHLSSNVTIFAPDGGTATGHCSLSWTKGLGLCIFGGGTGSLAGFHANLHATLVAFDDTTLTFTWDGTYHFDR
ncbi:MAG: hypothetical protein Q7S35_05690 [Candidatus Limnocylindrales bacterium]|nr:hypothetical protein [Candidatus Limnocylindrales bacterium]